MAESYDEAFRRGLEEAQGTRSPSPPPQNDAPKQGYEAGKAAGQKK